MSCATVDGYRGQFSLKLCQVTVIKLKGTQKAVGFACATLHGEPVKAASRSHCIPALWSSPL